MEEEFKDTKGFVIHTNNGDVKPKLIRPTLFPYPMLDFANYDTRMQKIRLARTGNLPNHPDAIREYLENNRTIYLFLGDLDFAGSVATLRYFDGHVVINHDPEPKHKSLITWAIDNAWYKYINAIDAYNRAVKSGKIDEELTTDEVSGEPVPVLGDGLLEEFYKKLEAEAEREARKSGKQPAVPQDALY